ncbi:MAG: DUF2846 domain-containing protein [Bryobacteraceae bacterium]|jgi:hypothetical protein
MFTKFQSNGKGYPMRNTAFSGVSPFCRRGACWSLANLLLAFSAIAIISTGPVSVAEDKAHAVLAEPSAGKAIVCIYRVGRITGSQTHDEIYVNGVHLGKLLNGEYEFTEVAPGTVVISGLPKVYYGSITMSAVAAANQATHKENERARFEAEAGKTYYFKWTAGAMSTGIKVTPEDPGVGAKEMSKLHLSKPPDDKDAAKPETKDADKPAAK